jgi:group I intron endonuclease
MIIYKVTNKINGMVYIGQTIFSLKKRKENHIWLSETEGKSLGYFHRAIKKYGTKNFEWEVLCQCASIDDLNKLEMYYIALYNTFENGYNLTMGGGGSAGHKHDKITKKKLSVLKLGIMHSKAHNKKISKSRTGQRLTEETKAKIASKLSGKGNPFYGYCYSEEYKKARSGKNSPSSHAIIIEGTSFESIGIASRSLNINSGVIWKRLKKHYIGYQYVNK